LDAIGRRNAANEAAAAAAAVPDIKISNYPPEFFSKYANADPVKSDDFRVRLKPFTSAIKKCSVSRAQTTS
jgi:hypothetical protein